MNGLTRVVFGSLVDKYSFKTLMSIIMSIQLVNACTCYWAAYIPALYILCIMVNYMVIGAIYAIFPVSVMNVFGLKHGPQIYVQILFAGFICSILNLLTTKYLLPATGNNFMTLYYAGAVAQVACLAMLFWFKEELDVKNLAKRNALEPIIAIPTFGSKKTD